MPIVFVHGVAVRRDPPYPPETAVFLREVIAPVIAPDDPGGVEVLHANWFDHAATFAWGGISTPASRSSVLEDEAAPAATLPERAIAAAQLQDALAGIPEAGGGGLLLDDADGAATPRPSEFSDDELSGFLVTVLRRPSADPADSAREALVALAADDVARDPDTRVVLATLEDPDEQLAELIRRVRDTYDARYAARTTAPGTLAGPFGFWDDWKDRASAALKRAGSVPGYVATRVLGPALKDVNAHFGVFTADILTYLTYRGTPEQPGTIPRSLLESLARARDIQAGRGGEPIVVLSHSMGGQLVYDAVSSFLPGSRDPRLADVRVDFWCAAASQVAYFQELKTFLGSRPDDPYGAPPRELVPFPDRRYLGGWWNVWDPNDYFSFTAKDIFADEVLDESYNGGLSGLRAHGGYLVQPAFFRRFAQRLEAARVRDWDRPPGPRSAAPAPAPPPILRGLPDEELLEGDSPRTLGLEDAAPPVRSIDEPEEAPALTLGLDDEPAPRSAPPETSALQPEPTPAPASQGWINAELRHQDGREAPQPLRVDELYTLMFDVDQEQRATSLVRGTRLQYRPRPEEQVVELTVQLTSEDFEIYTEPQTLRVSNAGKSLNKARFDLRAKHEGQGVVNALFLKDGNFIQLVTLKLMVGAAEEAPAEGGALPIEVAGRPVASAFALEPRDLLLLIKPAGLHFSLTLAGGVRAEASLPITLAKLNQMIEQARQELLAIVELRAGPGGQKVYQTGIDIPPEVGQLALQRLAKVGYRLYQDMFYGPAADRQTRQAGDALRAMARRGLLKIQVMSEQFLLPWGLLYMADRYDPDQVDPELFLGLRHIIEVIPLQPNMHALDSMTIASDPTLTVSLNVDADIDREMRLPLIAEQLSYWDRIVQQGGAEVIVRRTGDEVQRALADTLIRDQIIYFYCHAATKSLEDAGGPAASSLKFSDGQRLTLEDLMLLAPNDRLLGSAPLVFINACESAELSPLFYDGFVPYFMAKGARGVIGTECLVPALLAKEFARRFFSRFLAGERVGPALLNLRRELFQEHNNLLGLLYAVYCDGDTRVHPALRMAVA